MIVSEIQRLAGSLVGDQDLIIIKQQDFYDYINDGMLKICRETECLTGTNTGVASLYPLNFPADMINGKTVQYGTRDLPLIRKEDLDARQIDLTAQGEPLYYYYWNSKIYLYPDPNSTDSTSTSFYYSKTPTVISSGASTPEIPISFHEDLVQYVVMRCHERMQNQSAAERAQRDFDKSIAYRKEEATQKDDTYAVIRDDPWDDWFV